MEDQHLLMRALRSFAVAMGDRYDLAEVSYTLSEEITRALDVAGAGVSVATDDGKLRFLTATSQPVVEVEMAQEESQEGPCVAAFNTQQPVAVDDLEVSEWTGYASIARQHGMHAAVGYPLSRDGERIGALDVYSASPRKWSEDDLDFIGVFADMATAYLVRVNQLVEMSQLTSQLQKALDSRVVIEQAKGILANEHDITVDEAFELIRNHSRANNIKLSEVTDAVVNLGLRIPNPQ